MKDYLMRTVTAKKFVLPQNNMQKESSLTLTALGALGEGHYGLLSFFCYCRYVWQIVSAKSENRGKIVVSEVCIGYNEYIQNTPAIQKNENGRKHERKMLAPKRGFFSTPEFVQKRHKFQSQSRMKPSARVPYSKSLRNGGVL